MIVVQRLRALSDGLLSCFLQEKDHKGDCGLFVVLFSDFDIFHSAELLEMQEEDPFLRREEIRDL